LACERFRFSRQAAVDLKQPAGLLQSGQSHVHQPAIPPIADELDGRAKAASTGDSLPAPARWTRFLLTSRSDFIKLLR